MILSLFIGLRKLLAMLSDVYIEKLIYICFWIGIEFMSQIIQKLINVQALSRFLHRFKPIHLIAWRSTICKDLTGSAKNRGDLFSSYLFKCPDSFFTEAT